MSYNRRFARRFFASLLAGSVLWTTGVQASEKVIVFFKNPSDVQRIFPQNVEREKSLRNLNDRSLRQVDGRVEAVLPLLGGAVLEIQSATDFEKLQNHPSVEFVEREVIHPLPEPVRGKFLQFAGREGLLPDLEMLNTLPMPYGIQMVKAPEVWTVVDEGSRSRVAVLDTGIDKDHPALKDNFETGKDHVGSPSGPYEFFDDHGHGTHVAGTIAAQKFEGGFAGVAPKAKILAGRVCGQIGCPNTSVARGIEWAVQNKVDVINMSLGGAISTQAERKAVQAAEAAGVIVVAASGNSGTGKVSFPAALPTVIAVGAVDSTKKKTTFSQWGPELDVVAPGAGVVSSVPVGTGRDSRVTLITGENSEKVNSTGFGGAKEAIQPVKGMLVDAGLGKKEDFAKVSVTGKFALIQRGEITFLEKVKNAADAGAQGVVLYNNAPGLVQGALTSDGSVLPVYVAMIEQKTGETIKGAIAGGQTVEAQIQTVRTDYAQFDGTSMASPHTAGVVALIRSANKNLTPAQVRDLLKSSAEALGPNSNNEYGAGLVNAQTAVTQALSM